MHSLEIREANIPAHLDLEEDIQKQKNGQITFTLRINAGNIVDYNLTEYVDVIKKYFGVKTFAEFQVKIYEQRQSVERANKAQSTTTRNS